MPCRLDFVRFRVGDEELEVAVMAPANRLARPGVEKVRTRNREGALVMRLSATLAAVLGAAVAVFVVVGPASAASHPKLVGVVGKNDAFKITLKFHRKIVKTLKAGTYTVVIHDDSTIHSYDLHGPHGKAWKFTSTPFVGTKTFTVKFRPGKYKAYCAPHASTMFQRFRVK